MLRRIGDKLNHLKVGIRPFSASCLLNIVPEVDGAAKELDEIGATAANYVRARGIVVIRNLLSPSWIDSVGRAFNPVLKQRKQAAGADRGASRFYATPPFVDPFSDPQGYQHPLVLRIVKNLVGEDAVMCQWALDTPTAGSDYQRLHRDAAPLFGGPGDGETDPSGALRHFREPPPYQLALNFPLVDILPPEPPQRSPGGWASGAQEGSAGWTPEALRAVGATNGPLEVMPGTHRLGRAEGEAVIEAFEEGWAGSGAKGGDSDAVPALVPVWMRRGDALLRDVRGLHRGTPNFTSVPRPMVVVGYSRAWLRRPEVGVRVPRGVREEMGPEGRALLRFEPVVGDEEGAAYDPEREGRYNAEALQAASGESFR